MKTIASILVGSILLLGCSRQSSQPVNPAEIKYETKTMEWREESDTMRALGFTNHALIIFFTDKTKNIATNVDSLDQAANILGQYGWEFASSDVKGDRTVYHMKRQARKDGRFELVDAPATDFQK
jgi:hypothetical protein